MKSNNRLTLVDRVDFYKEAPKHRKNVRFSELSLEPYDLRVNVGLNARAYYTSKSAKQIEEILDELKKDGTDITGVYLCPSPIKWIYALHQ